MRRSYLLALPAAMLLGLWLSIPFGATAAAERDLLLFGRVVNAADESVPLAVVLLVNPQDSSIACHTVTDSIGRFVMGCALSGDYWLQTHVLGYKPYTARVRVPHRKPLELRLEDDPKEIAAVRVGARRAGVKVHGDTVKYNLKAFTTGMEKTLGDLLANLPGIKVAEDGTVTAQGKQVEKILFNGRDLYGDNVSLATQNVSSSVADSVKVVHGYSEYSLLDGFQNHDKTVIDVGVKAGMWNKITGEAQMGGGYRNAYRGKLNAMYLGKESMFSIAAAGNNVGRRTFGYSEYIAMLGGLPKNEDGAYVLTLDGDSYISQLLSPPSDTKYQRSEMVALNYTYNKGKRIKLQTAALLSGGRNQTERTLSGEYISGPATGATFMQKDQSRTDMLGGIGMINLTYNPLETYLLKYGISANLSESSAESSAIEQFRQTQHWNRERSRERPFDFSQSMVNTWKLGEHQLVFTLGQKYGIQNPRYTLGADSILYPFAVTPLAGMHEIDYDQRIGTTKINGELMAKLRINEEHFVQLSLGNEYLYWNFRGDYGGASQPRLQPGQPGTLNARTNLGQHDALFGAAWRKNEGLLQFTLGAKLHYLDYDATHGAGQRFQLRKMIVAPDLRLELEFSPTHTLTLSADMSLKHDDPIRHFGGWVPSSYSLMRYAYPATEHLFNRSYGLDLSYRITTDNSNRTFVLYGSYDYDVRTADATVSQDLLRLTSPWGRVFGQGGYLYSMLSQTVAVYWHASAYVSARYRQGESIFNGERIPTVSANLHPWFYLRSTYPGMWNVSARGEATFYRNRYAQLTPERYQEWEARARLIFQLDPVKVELGGGYRTSTLQGVGNGFTLGGEISYNVWGGLYLEAEGHDLLNLHSYEWAQISSNALRSTQKRYWRVPGYAIAKVRWEFGPETKRKRKRPRIVTMRL